MGFQSIHAVTWSVPDLAASVSAFREWLGFLPVSEGVLGDDAAAHLGAPGDSGAAMAVLRPANQAPAYVRLVEAPSVPGYAPLMTFGWNAVEFLVEDVHGLAERLAASPFEIIGPPRDLLDNDAVIAMQVKGPGEELLYLTEMRHQGLRKTFGAATCTVDRFFIAILGVSDQARTVDFYRPFAQRINIRRQFRITSIARAHGLDPDTARFDIASAVMSGPYRIETDAYPDTAVTRPVREGHLPPGLAVVSVLADADSPGVNWRGGSSWPGSATRSCLLNGPDSERLELLAAP